MPSRWRHSGRMTTLAARSRRGLPRPDPARRARRPGAGATRSSLSGRRDRLREVRSRHRSDPAFVPSSRAGARGRGADRARPDTAPQGTSPALVRLGSLRPLESRLLTTTDDRKPERYDMTNTIGLALHELAEAILASETTGDSYKSPVASVISALTRVQNGLRAPRPLPAGRSRGRRWRR